MIELEAIYDGRKSFYKKAKYYTTDRGTKVLISYNTEVAAITDYGQLVINGFYSATTTRHIREFARQFNENKFWNRKELEEQMIDSHVSLSSL